MVSPNNINTRVTICKLSMFHVHSQEHVHMILIAKETMNLRKSKGEGTWVEWKKGGGK